MALVVETGAGLANAESFASVAACDTYHTAYGNTAWAAATTGVKEIALRKATRYLEAVYRTRWYGRRVKLEQALSWPRVDVMDRDGFTVDSDEVPQSVINATAELALRALTEDLNPDLASTGTVASESVSVGPISRSVTYTGGKLPVKVYRVVGQMLSDLCGGQDSLERA